MKKLVSIVTVALSSMLVCSCGDNAVGADAGSDAGPDADSDADTDCDGTAAVLDLQGTLHTSVSDLDFERAAVHIEHKRDADDSEDGCISRIEIHLTIGDGCELVLIARQAYDSDGGLSVQDIEFAADSHCPGFPDEDEGFFDYTPGMATAHVIPDHTEVPGQNVESSCIDTTLVVHLEGALYDDVEELLIEPSEITISGEINSEGQTDTACPDEPV